MDFEHQNRGQFPSSDSSDVVRKPSSNKIARFFDGAHTSTTLLFLSSILEIVLSLGVIFATVTGFFQPLWLSSFMCLLASLTCVVGIFLLYKITHKDKKVDQLVRDAMRRVMNSQN